MAVARSVRADGQQQEPAPLSYKVKAALDEARILVLGAQVLVGASFRSAFEPEFANLPPVAKAAQAVSLVLMLGVITLLMLPGPYQQITERGNASQAVREFVTRIAALALLPFAVAMGLNLCSLTLKSIGSTAAIALGAAGVAVALACWYGIELVSRERHKEERMQQSQEDEKPTPAKDKITDVLTECRVVLPGAQALLGFQFISMLSQEFGKLPQSSKLVHVGSLAAMALAVICLMTPAAYHRLVEDGEATEHFHRFASRMLLLSMVPLAAGICGDFFVVLRIITEAAPLALAVAAVLFAGFLGAWFGLTWLLRQRKEHAHPRLVTAS